MATNKRVKRTGRESAASASTEFNPDYTYVKKDLTRIGTLAGIFVVVLIILSFVI